MCHLNAGCVLRLLHRSAPCCKSLGLEPRVAVNWEQPPVVVVALPVNGESRGSHPPNFPAVRLLSQKEVMRIAQNVA